MVSRVTLLECCLHLSHPVPPKKGANIIFTKSEQHHIALHSLENEFWLNRHGETEQLNRADQQHFASR